VGILENYGRRSSNKFLRDKYLKQFAEIADLTNSFLFTFNTLIEKYTPNGELLKIKMHLLEKCLMIMLARLSCTFPCVTFAALMINPIIGT